MKGFTLIELVIATALLLLLAGSIVANYNNYSDKQRIRQEALTLKNDLRLAQIKAISVQKPASGCSGYIGMNVTFSANSYSIQALCSEGLIGDILQHVLPSAVTFNPVPAPLTFRALTHTLTSDATETILLTGASGNYEIRVASNGDITEVGF
ncbi:prepilin-type N-terminal cleavage/methylation domain-containing protein [Patescibacteria group bacterium]|nr:prepilin-type N-terminal cleavage/methylation domain-containing protein [Patescibacteria group bacterium]MBU1472430.1 prepilin-type N-terminal cleavage/methylation domain-containing protein [Patescibacteria group bacterium]MBU2460245.1 prepilin-type N-terminal cleavage/methylation domain-containing protein [Patescibacteria group bacterium]MBU2544550.1 prepilin-type N-terminal cleavage/methylation domain-containing protein [Patescibacteria group bacterium]